MASVNKVILIGNLGRVSRDSLDAEGLGALDSYLSALHRFISSLDGAYERAISEPARKLAEALRLLRKMATPIAIPKKIAAPWTPLFGRSAAFFHAGKVDARNHP